MQLSYQKPFSRVLEATSTSSASLVGHQTKRTVGKIRAISYNTHAYSDPTVSRGLQMFRYEAVYRLLGQLADRSMIPG